MRNIIDKKELPKLLELEKSLFDEKAWSLESLRNEIENPLTKIFVIEDEFSEILGYIIIRILVDEAEILRFGIKKEKQGKGLGKTLLGSVLDELRRREVKRVFLEVAVDNLSALRLYESFKFNKVGERRGYYSPKKSAYIMCKILEEGNYVKSRD